MLGSSTRQQVEGSKKAVKGRASRKGIAPLRGEALGSGRLQHRHIRHKSVEQIERNNERSFTLLFREHAASTW